MNDTIVIGAGLAGLSAAKCLVGHGYSVVLIEARDRAGGRVWTQRPGTMEIPIDLGAEWIGAGQLREILERAGAKIQKARGTRWQCREGECRKLPDFSRLMEEFLKKARSVTATDLSVCEAFERCFLRQEREEDQRVLLGYIEGFHAADPAKAGLFWLDDVEDSDSAKEYEMRSPAGAGRAVDALLASIQSRCDIRFSTSAQEIRWQRGEVAVATLRQDGDRNVLRAASVVVTVPLPLLAGSDHEPTFRIVPALTEKLYAARQIEMGHVLKLVLRFHEPFWRNSKVVKDFLFLHNPDQPFPTWWTALDHESPILTAWAGGPRALEACVRQSPIDTALDSLARILGWSRSAIDAQWVETFFHDWSSDPCARGAYTYGGVGGSAAFEEIARPVDNTLFFAGEATCGGGLNATMEGALRSGSRAAEEIRQARAAA